MKHITVLLEETVELLKSNNGNVYVDLTLGSGGHSLRLLESLSTGTLLVFDLDGNAISSFQTKLEEKDFTKKEVGNEKVLYFKNDNLNVYVIKDNFIKLKDYLALLKIEGVDGVIADLGWSTDELRSIEGLSYEREDDELDMRFDKSLGVKASDLLNALHKKELEKLFSSYADIYGKHNKNLVDEILKFRSSELIRTVDDLLRIINRAYDFDRRSNKFSIYSKVFQALRIAVNQELNNLEDMLNQAYDVLNEKGNLLVITFHSGEEKVVENKFNDLVEDERVEYITHKFRNKFITPTVEELKNNLQARSAKLFGITKN